MKKWEYIELRLFQSGSSFVKSSIQFMPGNKIDMLNLKQYFSKCTSAQFEITDVGQLVIILPSKMLHTGYIAASDYLGELGWEAYAVQHTLGNSGDTSTYFKRPLQKSDVISD